MSKRLSPLAQALQASVPPTTASALLLDRGLESLVLAQLLLAHPEAPCLIITDTLAHAEALAAELRPVLALLKLPAQIQLFPELEAGRRHLTPETESERARLLHQLGNEPAPLVIASLMAALSPLPAPVRFQATELVLRVGASDWPPQRLAKYLAELDYDNEAEVHVPGEFSWRGGILDVFSPAHEHPLRLDYFGDTLESLRFLDPTTQRDVCYSERLQVEEMLTKGKIEAKHFFQAAKA